MCSLEGLDAKKEASFRGSHPRRFYNEELADMRTYQSQLPKDKLVNLDGYTTGLVKAKADAASHMSKPSTHPPSFVSDNWPS